MAYLAIILICLVAWSNWQNHKIQRGQKKLMATVADLVAKVSELTTVEQSAEALLDGLSQQLKDAVAANDPAAIQGVIDSLDAGKSQLAAAVTRNTPAAPPAPPA